tara:strand:- start:11914 stop:12324 length:411 start_codon:yes stop_codon:yes gene_type:complete
MEQSIETKTHSNTPITEGIYVFRDTEENETCLFIFKKLTKEQMDIALPTESGESPQSNYFIGMFRKGCDYLGKTEYSGIERIMTEEKMYNLEDSYEKISKNFDHFSEEEYTKYKDFSNKHMETFRQIEKHVPPDLS